MVKLSTYRQNQYCYSYFEVIILDYFYFSFGFIIIHVLSYASAGAISQKIAPDFQQEKRSLLDFLRDMRDPQENLHIRNTFLTAQVLRGFLLSLALYPILGFLGELAFPARALFFGGLMFIYTDLASSVPFISTLEGHMYLKDRYMKKIDFWKLYLETFFYSLIFGLLAAWFLF